MKKWFERSVTLLLAIILMTSCLVGCGDKTADGTIEVWSGGVGTEGNKEAKQALMDFLAGLSEVPIKWQSASSEAFTLAFSSGDFPEVVMGNYLASVDVVKYAANGI